MPLLHTVLHTPNAHYNEVPRVLNSQLHNAQKYNTTGINIHLYTIHYIVGIASRIHKARKNICLRKQRIRKFPVLQNNQSLHPKESTTINNSILHRKAYCVKVSFQILKNQLTVFLNESEKTRNRFGGNNSSQLKVKNICVILVHL